MTVAKYEWLRAADAPRVIVEAAKLIGTVEVPGAKSSPVIMGWAKECGLQNAYGSDDVAWCGLFAAVVVRRANYVPVEKPLWARNWAKWGNPVDAPMLGDVLTFTRGSGGHVAFYVGEDRNSYHVLGGNQSDAVNIMRLSKDRLIAARRCPWRTAQPASVRKIIVNGDGVPISINEA